MVEATGHNVISAPPTFDVVTVIPYADKPEYRHHAVDRSDLPLFLDSMANPQHAERVIHVEPANGASWGDLV